MQQTSSYEPTFTAGRPGGRIGSPGLRASLEQAEDFAGLEQGVNRYDLLLLVKKAGRAAGFTPRMIALLDYYMAYTRDIDWEQGSQPVVYQSLARTALDMGVSERQIQRLEQSLFDIGAISWNDSGNHKRYGQRCNETGAILYAYGVDLTPLAYLKPVLEEKLAVKQEHDRLWFTHKRQISWYRAQIRAGIAELGAMAEENPKQSRGLIAVIETLDSAYNAIAIQIRTHMAMETLEELLGHHKTLYERTLSTLEDNTAPATSPAVEAKVNTSTSAQAQENASPATDKTDKESCRGDKNVAHYNSTTYKKSNKLDTSNKPPLAAFTSLRGRRNEWDGGKQQPSVPVAALKTTGQGGNASSLSAEEVILSTGLQHISLKQVLNACSPRFKEHLPLALRPMDWNDVIEAAYTLKGTLGISQNSWGQACVTLGRTGAAICVMLTEQGMHRTDDPVTKPAGYFNAMIKRAGVGELHLHNSVFGILKREAAEQGATL